MNGTNDRRSNKRFRLNMTVTLFPMLEDGSGGDPVEARVHDISERGISVRSSTAFSEGSQLLLSVEFDAQLTWFLGSIRYSNPDAGRSEHVSGMHFMALPTTGAKAEAINRIRARAA